MNIRRHIGFLMTVLLLLGGVTNEAWGKVTYHILTLPFTTKNDNGADRFTNIRVEALKCSSDELTVGLPENFMSPLVDPSTYTYYTSASVTVNGGTPTRSQIYQYMTTTYDTYAITGAPIAAGSAIADNSDIYVTYEFDNNESPIKLDGSVDYNIKLGNRFLCFNKGRANRLGAILETNVSDENRNNADFTYVETPGFDNNHDFHFRFWYVGNDPYNITIRTSYNLDATFRESDKALGKTVTKWYKGSSLFAKGESDGRQMLWMASDDDKQYTQTDPAGEVTYINRPGFYRGGDKGACEMDPIWNSFAILQPDPDAGYIYVATKVNSNGHDWQPVVNNGQDQYFCLTGTGTGNGRDPKFQLKTFTNAEKSIPFPVDTFTYKVTTPLSSTVISVDVLMSNYRKDANLLLYVPEEIKRKYVTFTGAYKTSALDGLADNTMTTFEDALANGKEIWLKYTTSMPFESLSSISSYDNAHWYTIRMNGDQENKNIAFYDTENSNVISTGLGSNSDLHSGENSSITKMAFIGDPFELKILVHEASEAITEARDHIPLVSDNRYMGCATVSPEGTSLTAVTGSSDISSWEIVYENTQMETMILRQMGTIEAPKYIGWNSSAANKPVIYSTTSSRIKVVPMQQKEFVYHIVRADGTIAAKASETQDVGKRLKFTRIPEVIRSPFINPSEYTATLSFYLTEADANAETNAISHTPYDPDTEGNDIYVRYTANTGALTKNYHVRLNGQYVYYDNTSEQIKSQVEEPDSGNDQFVWHLDFEDPYAMTIQNIKIDADPETHDPDKYLKKDGVNWGNDLALTFDEEEANASLFIVKSSTIDGIYEVMAATGNDVDASTTYYNIGRPAVNTVKIYSNATYSHGNAQLRFLLTPTDATTVEYHLYDKSGTELLTVRSRRTDLYFPADYRSPLVETYHYWTTSACNATLSNLASAEDENGDGIPDIYVTYTTSDRVNLQKGVMYLLKFETGDSFRQEDGADGLTESAVQAVYPYCNGDCNFFLYGQAEYELQQQGAASTRTRWAWYLESDDNDPYHVKICSRQTETFNDRENRGYFRTFIETFGGEKHVVTNLAWPGITGNQGTEYMVLGSVGQYQLMTTYKVDVNGDGDISDPEDERQVVKAFEQYWKTFDTLRKKIFGDPASDLSVEDPTTVPATPLYAVTSAAGKSSNRDYLEQEMGFHHYAKWAYAKRWNGFNISGAKSKGWEEIEHWYQTVNMGEGYFDFVEIDIEPVLILLDQHGWEIMRKPLPSSPDDPTKQAKYEVIRPYNSPMVKEYYFWGSAKKRTGFHQYYSLSGQMKVDGKVYTSTDLTKLPDYYNADGTRNSTIFDKKGNQLDQYVTYVAKDEYAESYNPSTKTGTKFLIQQGSSYASTSNGESITTNAVGEGGLSQTIVAASGSIADNYLWYVKPNSDIDQEMGYDVTGNPGHSWTNDYNNSVAKSGFNSNGFDPYNIQITSAAYPTKYFVTNADTAQINEGSIVGDGTTNTLGAKASIYGTGQDSRTMQITNATFMAVQDEDGNMQLMPRFDQTKRINSFTSLVVDQIGDAVKLPNTHTQLFRPLVYNYHIIDNSGQESLRYQSGGDLVPQMPEHFKSPLAKTFKYYKTLEDSNSDGVYELATLADEITSSFAAAGITTNNADVYIRYIYDTVADNDHILQGKWYTIQLNEKDAKFDSGIKQGDSKPATINGSEKTWQWKFLETPQTAPDPYAVYLYNRSQSEGTKAINKRFALLSHTSGGYALAEAGTGLYVYAFLNGASMTTSDAATMVTEAGFTSTACAFDGTGSQVKLIDDVEHTYTYKVYTNGTNGSNAVKYGVLAISSTQSQATAAINEFVPILPDSIMTPLLSADQFLYYEKESDMGDANEELQFLYGLYEDDVYVRYKAYDESTSPYLVPNEKGYAGTHVARGPGSNDTHLGLNGNLIYNVVWYSNNMMKRNGDNIQNAGTQNLKAEPDYEWLLEGNDPYAIKIKSVGANKYVYNNAGNSCILGDNATTFMLLNKNGHDYGILQVTGDTKSRKWTSHGESLTANAADAPTQFIIFALATNKVIYHLVLANTGNKTETIPYRADQNMPETPVAWTAVTDEKQFDGTTQRDLSTTTYQLGSTINGQNYSYDAGAISLGAQLTCPSVFYRPNLVYHYIVEGVYDDNGCNTPNSDLNDRYKGYEIDKMGDNTGLLGKTIRINIVYNFNGDLQTNNGEDFVTDVADNKWYTFETEDANGTPWLAQFTNAWGVEVKEGRAIHYTNDYLWSPLGDPYGFKMYNRYIYKTNGELTRILRLTAVPATNGTLTMADPPVPSNNWDIFELISSGTEGTFLIHPMVNMTGTQYYFKITKDGSSSVVKLNRNGSQFIFGLSEDLMSPYYDRAGYIGGLNDAGKTAYETAAAIEDPADRMMALQQVVYNDDHIIPFTPGYYRLHSPEGLEGINPKRYASGYTHKSELTAGAGSTPIPMHFHEKEDVETIYEFLPSKDGLTTGVGFTSTNVSSGEIPIPAVEYDPASIFHITGTYNAAKMSTQGLYVEEEHMTETAGGATSFYLMDIGGGIFLIHDNATPAERKYFCYDQADASHIYDLKFIHDCHTDHAKWCIQPANMLGLNIKTHSGGDEEKYGTSYNYASAYFPFDILLPDDDTEVQEGQERERVYEAFICDSKNSPWSPPNDLHPKAIGRYNIAANNCPEPYRGSDKFVPAGTPVLLAMWDQSDTVRVTIPTSAPSTTAALISGFSSSAEGDDGTRDNILSGEYLEQLLPYAVESPAESTHRIYTFGLPFSGTFSMNPSSGEISSTLPTQDNHGLGFYLNANPNKESGLSKSNWKRNNFYVLGNKVYYHHTSGGGSPAPKHKDIDYVPVNFDFEIEEQPGEEEPGENNQGRVGDGCVYDILGRKVATEAQVKAGTWYQGLQPGVYIVDGQKISIM